MDLDEDQAKISTQQAMLNVLSVLNEAVGADMSATSVKTTFYCQGGHSNTRDKESYSPHKNQAPEAKKNHSKIKLV